MHWLDFSFLIATIAGLVITLGSVIIMMTEPRRINGMALAGTKIGCGIVVICMFWLLVRKPVTLFFFGVELP